MSGLWPWLAVAGAGALHGLNPAELVQPSRERRKPHGVERRNGRMKER